MDKGIIDKEMFDNFLMSVPTMVVDTKDRKTISAYGSIDVDDLRSVLDTFKKVPEYGELLKKVKKQQEAIDKIKRLKQFYIKDFEERNITMIPLSNLTKNIDIVLKEVSK